MFGKRKENVDLENAPFRAEGDAPAVLIGDQKDALYTESVVIAVFLFRERKAVGGKRDLADIIIFYGDGDEGLHGMYVERDTAALFFRDLRDRLDRVVHEISEERIQVAVADEREPAAFRHAGQIDLLVLADKALFGEQDVHRLVARVHERVVDGDRLADLFRLRALDVALPENAVDLMPYRRYQTR